MGIHTYEQRLLPTLARGVGIEELLAVAVKSMWGYYVADRTFRSGLSPFYVLLIFYGCAATEFLLPQGSYSTGRTLRY